MSEHHSSATHVLLPEASVAIYSEDKDTLAAARELDSDWRFARVHIEIVESDMHAAMLAYEQIESPDLIVLQTEDVGDNLVEQLETLAGHCREDTAAVLIGPVNDVYLYRKLIGMGISDYLVRPVDLDVFKDVIAKTLIERVGTAGSRLIAMVGSCGGAGVSSLMCALAFGLSDTLEQKTLALDFSGGWSCLSVAMGGEPSTTLAEAVRAAENNDEASLARMLIGPNDRLKALASGGDVMLDTPVTSEGAEKLLDMVMQTWPVILADLSGAPNDVRHAVISRAHRTFVVTPPGLYALRLCRGLIQEIGELRGGEDGDISLILNKVGQAASTELAAKEIEDMLECKLSYSVPYLPKLFLGVEAEDKNLSQIKDGAPIVSNLVDVMRPFLLHEDGSAVQASKKPADGRLSGLLGKLGLKG